ncbi:hypothetical protein Tcan_01885 [Toxocara canis]|uniref:Uncharacterized protein n=1 Tax=Toxocara canis TaxID=6265 RepID=A0A0B2VMR5_TOXCA|nr:hypothetical protein Tcan_01885 [Toxocara canis]
MSPQQSTFRHAVSFSYGPSSPASVPHTAGQNNGYHTPQQVRFSYLLVDVMSSWVIKVL